MNADDRLNRMARQAIVVAGMSAVTLLLTLTFQLLIARTFGATTQLDAFLMAFSIPRAIVESFHFGLLTLLFVLVFHRKDENGTGDPWEQSSAVLNVTLLATCVGIGGLIAGAHGLVRFMAPGFSPEDVALSASLLRALALVLVPTAIAAALGGLAIAQGRILSFTLSRAAMPALQIGILLACAASLGVWALVWASWIGAAGAVVIYAPWFRSVGFRHRLTLNLGDPRTRGILKLQGLLALAWIVINFNQIAARYFASLLGPGQVSALEFAWRFEIPISQIVSLAVALPTFALLAQTASVDRRDDFRGALGASAKLLVLTVIPMLGFLVIMRTQLTGLWLGGGVFTPDAVQLVASLLPPLAVVYFCRAFASVLVFGLLMTERIGLLLAGLITEVILNVILCATLSRTLGLQAIVVASAVSMVIVNLSLWTVLLREVDAFTPGRMLAHVRPHLAAAVLAVAVLEVVRRALDGYGLHESGIQGLLLVGGLGAGYVLTYVAACIATGVIHVRMGGALPRLALRSLE